MNFSQRIDQPELMDTVLVPAAVMKQTLSSLRLMNRYFGGSAVILKHLRTWSKKWDHHQTIEILDVGTGGAEIPIDVIRWARKNKFNLHVTGIDLVAESVHVAAEASEKFSEIDILQKDFFELAEEGKKYDYVIASLFLHHISPEKTSEVLRAFDQIAERGVIISDLQRSLLSYGAVSLLSHLIGNKIVKHDGPLSVRRAFTVEELDGMAQTAGLLYLKASPEPWFRLSLAGEKT